VRQLPPPALLIARRTAIGENLSFHLGVVWFGRAAPGGRAWSGILHCRIGLS
jgi:hypothetical protein